MSKVRVVFDFILAARVSDGRRSGQPGCGKSDRWDLQRKGMLMK
jgi:hypothetical protein